HPAAQAGGTMPEILRRAAREPDEASRRRRALHQELAVRAGVAVLMLIFNELLTITPQARTLIRIAAIVGLLINVPYYLAPRFGWRRRLQAWGRMSMDVAFITVGLRAAGGPRGAGLWRVV